MPQVTAPAPVSALPNRGVLSGGGRARYLAGLTSVVLTAEVTLCNSGAVAGVEVVQVYSQDPSGPSVSPLGIVPFWKRLVGYGRLALGPGACGTLSVDVTADDLALYDDDMVLRVAAGTYIITAGGRSDLDT